MADQPRFILTSPVLPWPADQGSKQFQLEVAREGHRVRGHPLGMAAGVGVLGVHSPCQGCDGLYVVPLVGLEEVGVAVVVEGVDQDVQRIVAPQRLVALHLLVDEKLGLVVVTKNPEIKGCGGVDHSDFGSLRCGLPGIGLALHALNVFEVFNIFGPDWERKQVEKRLGRKL